MKEEYIKKVTKELSVPHNQKREIIRDLNEAFDSAKEHGETEKQVIDRLGTPKSFADNIHEQLGINCIERQIRKKQIQIGIAITTMMITFAIGILIRASRVPENVIGQADSMTSMQIHGPAIDLSVLFMSLGIVALVIAVALIVQYLLQKVKEET